MFVTKKHLPRRTFLRGMGVGLALPFLDAMVPARTLLAATAANPALRFGFLYVPHGAIMENWTPAETGPDYELTRALQPLAPVREHVSILTNLAFDAPNNHPLSNTMWLSGHLPKSTSPEEVNTGVTVDQVIAAKLGQETRFPSLELAIEDFSVTGTCQPGYACVLLNTLSWKTPTMPLPTETNPRLVFERMFGEGDSEDARQALRAEQRSILDAVIPRLGSLQRQLGAVDRRRVSDYLDNVREVERRIQQAERKQAVAVPEAPTGIPESYEEHVKLMFDLMSLAYQTDTSRVVSFMLARELSQQSYSWLGNMTDGHHTVSHHQGNADMIEQVRKINVYHTSLLAGFIEQLRNTPDGDGSLLDHCLLVYGSGMSNGNGHTHDPLPMLVAGKACGQLKPGRHIKYPAKTPLANFLLTVLDQAGIHEEQFGASTGRVEL